MAKDSDKNPKQTSRGGLERMPWRAPRLRSVAAADSKTGPGNAIEDDTHS